MEIFPAIDIRSGKVVRLIQGDYGQQIDYAADPVEVAGGFVNCGAGWVHIVDLDGARTGRSLNLEVIKRVIEATELQAQVGGGIRTEGAIRDLLGAGASRVIIGTRALEDWDWFRRIAGRSEFAGKIVLGLDARDGKLAGRGWTDQTELRAVDLASQVSDWPIAAIVYTDIARDGMLTGPNLEQIEAMAKATDVPIIASGGVHCLDDVCRLAGLGVAGVIIGRALYEGKIDLAEAIKIVRT